ncbi:MAG: hypothetical protein KF788_17965 [Piscinibacter sp.]|nr:hypothetical protein [Piscinibacter sp.]
MGALLDTIADALRPLPGAPNAVLRRAPAGAAEPLPDEVEADDGAALTVYRLQKDGGDSSPPLAPLHGPSTPDSAAPNGAGSVGGADERSDRIAHPWIGRKDGLERGEQRTRHTVERRAESLSQSRLSPEFPVPSSSVSVTSRPAPSVAVEVPVVVSAPVERTYEAVKMREPARGAPSEDLLQGAMPQIDDGPGEVLASGPQRLESTGEPAVVAAPLAERAPPPALHLATVAQRDVPPATPQRATPRAPPQPPAPGGLRIGRIEVTVLADAPRAKPEVPAAAPLDSRFLSRHYLRRT